MEIITCPSLAKNGVFKLYRLTENMASRKPAGPKGVNIGRKKQPSEGARLPKGVAVGGRREGARAPKDLKLDAKPTPEKLRLHGYKMGARKTGGGGLVFETFSRRGRSKNGLDHVTVIRSPEGTPLAAVRHKSGAGTTVSVYRGAGDKALEYYDGGLKFIGPGEHVALKDPTLVDQIDLHTHERTGKRGSRFGFTVSSSHGNRSGPAFEGSKYEHLTFALHDCSPEEARMRAKQAKVQRRKDKFGDLA